MSGKGSRPRPVDQEVYGKEWERIFRARADEEASRRARRSLLECKANYLPAPGPPNE